MADVLADAGGELVVEEVTRNGELHENTSYYRSVEEVSTISASELTACELSSLSMLEDKHNAGAIVAGECKVQKERESTRGAVSRDVKKAINGSPEPQEDGYRAVDENNSMKTTSIGHLDTSEASEKNKCRRNSENEVDGRARVTVSSSRDIEPVNVEEDSVGSRKVGSGKENAIQETKGEGEDAKSSEVDDTAAIVMNGSKYLDEEVTSYQVLSTGRSEAKLCESSSVTSESTTEPVGIENSDSSNKKTKRCDDKLEGYSGNTTSSLGLQKDNKSDWVDILGSGELLKKVIQPGKGLSTRPSHQSRVKVHTRGFLHSKAGTDKCVDKHSSVEFTVGDGDVIQAWDIAVTLMEVGELAQLKTSARFAYGEVGKLPAIPGNADLTYELELMDVQPPLMLATINEKQLMEVVEVKKTRGNELYNRGEYLKSINSYHKGLQAVQSYLTGHGLSAAQAPPSIADLLIRCENNIAAAQIKAENYTEALSACESVLQLDADNVKALYRAGRALGLLGEWRKAIGKLEKAAALDPDNRVIQTELHKISWKRDVAEKKERDMYRRMVSGSPKNTAKTGSTTEPSFWGPWPYMAVAGVIGFLALGAGYYFTQRP